MPVNSFLVLGVVPANNEQQVPVNTSITISFAKHMDVNTLTDANIKLRKVNGEYIPYTPSYNHEDYRLVLRPSSFLSGSTQYQVEIVGGTTGIRSVTGDYTSTRTYEFSTVLTKSISNPQNLVVSQKNGLLSAKWDAPSVVNESEALSYNVRVSASNDPDSPYLWPTFPVGTEYDQSGTTLSIPDPFETGRNYYVMVRAVNASDTSDWTTTQIYVEAPVTEIPTEPGEPSTPPPINDQIDILEVYPSQGGIIQDSLVMIAFSDAVDVLPANAIYVVQAPYKAQLSALDLLTRYSPSKAVPGTVSLVEGNAQVLQWKATGDLPVETEYTVVVSKDIKGTSMDSLGVPMTYSFRTPWARLYGSVKAIKDRLGDIGSFISDSAIYDSMRVNTLYAYETASNTTTFEPGEYTETEAPYYVHQYVNLQTAYDVLLNDMANSGGGGTEQIMLGQLQVNKESSATSAVSLLSTLKSEMKPWLDMIHGHRNRGYAKPGNAVKGEAGSPYPDYLTRSELKTNFDV